MSSLKEYFEKIIIVDPDDNFSFSEDTYLNMTPGFQFLLKGLEKNEERTLFDYLIIAGTSAILCKLNL